MDQALYKCNWPFAPLREQKMIAIYKINFIKPTYIEGGAFFIAQWEAMSNVCLEMVTAMTCPSIATVVSLFQLFKKSYYFLTIMMENLA